VGGTIGTGVVGAAIYTLWGGTPLVVTAAALAIVILGGLTVLLLALTRGDDQRSTYERLMGLLGLLLGRQPDHYMINPGTGRHSKPKQPSRATPPRSRRQAHS